MRRCSCSTLSATFLGLGLLVPLAASASEPGSGDHSYARQPKVRTIDLSGAGHGEAPRITAPAEQPDFAHLDDYRIDGPPMPDNRPAPGVPEGMVQQGDVVVPSEVARGLQADLDPRFAVEDIPGNEYPRKHTLFLNFNGGMLHVGPDNSAESRSTLAIEGEYPVFTGGESTAIAIVQAVQADLEPYGVQVVYAKRPPKTLPYTMEMIGGTWQDTNLGMPAGGVSGSLDCGALGQRHVVYTFSQGGSVLTAASTAAQEAGHAWGLDHSRNCNSVMSYCGSGDQVFSNTCDELCEFDCQGAAGCRSTHEEFCGEGSDRQNEAAELEWLFGGNEPDMEPPSVEIVEPVDGVELEAGAGVNLRAVVSDNYGGYAWKFMVEKDGEVLLDEPDYDREVDPEYRAALNFSGLQKGVYTLTVEAMDHFEHVTTQSVTVYVGVAAEDGGSESGGDETGGETGGGGTGAASTTGAADESGGGEATGGQSGDGGGCAVGRPSAGDLGWAALVPIFGGFFRRRRNSRNGHREV